VKESCSDVTSDSGLKLSTKFFVGVGAQGQLTRGSNGLSPGTKYKRSKIVFTVISCGNGLDRFAKEAAVRTENYLAR